MRILFLSNFFPPHDIGGYEQWCSEVASGLVRRGHEVALLTSCHGIVDANGNPGTAVDTIAPDLVQDVTRSLHLQSDIAYYRPADFFLNRRRQERANQEELRLRIRNFLPDVIMVWGMWNLSQLLPYHAETLMPGRVAYYISNYWPIDIDAHTAYWKLPTQRSIMGILKLPLRAAALRQLQREGYPPKLEFRHAVCCSQYVRKTLVDAGKLPESAGVLLGGTDPHEFVKFSNHKARELREPLQLLYFGRLIHDKGVHTALEALSILDDRNLLDRVELTILGSGHPEYEELLQTMVAQEGLGAQVRFIPQVPRDEIPELLGRFDVFLFTSIWPEPMARSVMEAMAAGLLVIGTEVGGQSEMLSNGHNALTFPAEDASQLAEHICAAVRNPSLRLELANAGQRMILERFTLERMVSEIEDYLVRMLD